MQHLILELVFPVEVLARSYNSWNFKQQDGHYAVNKLKLLGANFTVFKEKKSHKGYVVCHFLDSHYVCKCHFGRLCSLEVLLWEWSYLLFNLKVDGALAQVVILDEHLTNAFGLAYLLAAGALKLSEVVHQLLALHSKHFIAAFKMCGQLLKDIPFLIFQKSRSHNL